MYVCVYIHIYMYIIVCDVFHKFPYVSWNDPSFTYCKQTFHKQID